MSSAFARRAVLAAIGIAITTAVPAVADSAVGTVRIDGGAVHGLAVAGGYEFRGLPYAAPPTGDLRWREPQPPAGWEGVRDATQFAPNCPQTAMIPPGLSEDCLYLNVSTPALPERHEARRPVLVWIHGGGLTKDSGLGYDGTKLAATGLVVVTINYRLGVLGFLAHPSLASRPGGPQGNYGWMDQQAALRWVRHNIARFGGDANDVTIAGESAGGLSVLAQLVSVGARGLFDRAVVQSGAFALEQRSLPEAQAAGEAFATAVDCPDQTAQCLRRAPVSKLVGKFPGAAIPGVVDGKVITESVGTALAGGRFARVPILNGFNHDEERLFISIGQAVSGGTFVDVPAVMDDNYQSLIASVLGVSAARAAAIGAEYPLSAYPSAVVAFSTLVSDANFACPALQLNSWTSRRVATYSYQFNDDNAPHRLTPPGLVPPVATHVDELQYLFDLRTVPVPGTLNPDQEVLAASMRRAWANFAASGNPSSAALPWPSFNGSGKVMSLAVPQSQVDTANASRHHCSFWAAP